MKKKKKKTDSRKLTNKTTKKKASAKQKTARLQPGEVWEKVGTLVDRILKPESVKDMEASQNQLVGLLPVIHGLGDDDRFANLVITRIPFDDIMKGKTNIKSLYPITGPFSLSREMKDQILSITTGLYNQSKSSERLAILWGRTVIYCLTGQGELSNLQDCLQIFQHEKEMEASTRMLIERLQAMPRVDVVNDRFRFMDKEIGVTHYQALVFQGIQTANGDWISLTNFLALDGTLIARGDKVQHGMPEEMKQFIEVKKGKGARYRL